MFEKIIDLESFKNMDATGGVTIVLNLPLGEIMDEVIIKLTNITHAQCTNMKYIVNNRTIQEYETGTLLQLINDWYGRPQDSGYLHFYFERPEMQENFEKVTSIGTLGIQSHRIEITLASGLTNAAISAQGVFRVGRNTDERTMSFFTKMVKIPYQFSAGLNQLTQEITRGDRIMALHLYGTDFTEVEVEADSAVIFEGLKGELDRRAADYGRAPDSALASFDFCLRGRHDSALVTAYTDDEGSRLINNLLWRITKTGAAQANMYVEYLRNFRTRGL